MDRGPFKYQAQAKHEKQPLPGLLGVAAMAFGVLGTPAFAQTSSLIEGLPAAAQYCQLVLTQAGSMHPSVDRKRLSSTMAGGQPGYVNVTTTNGRYRLFLDVPKSFASAPARGNDNVKFAAGFRGNGATNFGPTAHTQSRKLRRGMTRVMTNIHATKTHGAFPAGHYSAALTVRCE